MRFKKHFLLLFCICFCGVLSAQESRMSRHEISLSYGFAPVSEWIDFYSDFWGSVFTGTAWDSHSSGITGSINLAYNYRINKTWSLGGVFAYTGYKKEWHNKGRYQMSEHLNYYTLMPRLKANWLHSKVVTLYSTVAMGVTLSTSELSSENDQLAFWSFQFSPIGIEVGKTVSGFAEVGIGQMGVLQAGIRYRIP